MKKLFSLFLLILSLNAFAGLTDPEELEFIGFYEYQDEPNSLVIIEWASRAAGYLTPPNATLDIKRLDDEQREVTISFAWQPYS